MRSRRWRGWRSGTESRHALVPVGAVGREPVEWSKVVPRCPHLAPTTVATLATLVAGPPLLLMVLNLLREGRDLTGLLLIGSAGILLAGVYLAVGGVQQRNLALGIVGGSLVASALASFCAGALGIFWVGVKDLVVTVRVTDADTGLPIADADVYVFDRDKALGKAEAKTDAQGEARLHHGFWSHGFRSLVCDTGVVRCSWEMLAVEAAGYRSLRERLTHYTAGERPHHDAEIPPIEVALTRDRP